MKVLHGIDCVPRIFVVIKIDFAYYKLGLDGKEMGTDERHKLFKQWFVT